MSNFKIVHDNISKIPKNVKQLRITAVHGDAFTLGQNANDDGESKKSSLNSRTGHCIYREEYRWLNDTVRLRDVLLWIIANGFHKFRMLPDRNGSFKGCRHHTKTILDSACQNGWIGSRAKSNKTMNEFLQFVYTVIDDDSDEGVIRAAHAIDEGQFL